VRGAEAAGTSRARLLRGEERRTKITAREARRGGRPAKEYDGKSTRKSGKERTIILGGRAKTFSWNIRGGPRMRTTQGQEGTSGKAGTFAHGLRAQGGLELQKKEDYEPVVEKGKRRVKTYRNRHTSRQSGLL